ncbi:SCO7613 C-terminal domain-containing membrane protein [Streptomyces sp. KR80]|uniref:SCO7613 C-terminal domain-containing membrane protein n=1 Tax=Streptomyces sp. KR80 TaxID=3457426 RepID=UPI003FCEE914
MDKVPPVEELRQIDWALGRVEAERTRLLARRAQLLAEMRQTAPGPAPTTGAPHAALHTAPARSGRETSPPTVQNVLLALGGILLAVAATAFTVVSWGHLGIGGRAAVLGALTLTALSVPALLLRRSLAATAEVVACLGLVLLALDAYAIHRVAVPEADGAGYAGVASAVMAAIWTAYGRWLRAPGGGGGSRSASRSSDTATVGIGAPMTGLRLPLPIAVSLAQLPLFLWAVSVGAGPFGFGCVLFGTAAADLALALRRPYATGVRSTAAVSAAVTGASSLLLAATLSVTADAPGDAARAAALLLAAAAVGVTASWRMPVPATPAGPGRAGEAAAPGTTGVLSGGSDAHRPDGEPGWVGATSRVDRSAGVPTEPGTDHLGRPGRAMSPGAPSSAAHHDPAPQAAARRWPGHGLVSAAWPAAAAGLAVVAALGGVLRTGLSGQWTVVGYLLCGSLVLAAARATAGRTAVAAGLAAAAGVVHAGAVLWSLPAVAAALLGPVGWASAVWSGAPQGSRDALGPGLSWPGTSAAPVVLAVVATAVLAVHRHATGRPWRSALSAGSVAVCCALGVVLPVALGLPYPVAVALLVAQAGVLLVASATLTSIPGAHGTADTPAAATSRTSAHVPGRPSTDAARPDPGSTDGPGTRRPDSASPDASVLSPEDGSGPASLTALVCAVALALTAAFWGLAEQAVTLGVLGALLVAFTAAAVTRERIRQSVTAGTAGVTAVALTVALCAAAGLAAHLTSFAVLAVAAAAALLAARLRALPAGLPVECTGYAATALAVGLSLGNGPALASVLALAGVLATGTALRRDRRAAARAAVALFVLATWVRLAASGVSVPEAYTLPVSAAALFIGLRRRRQAPPPGGTARAARPRGTTSPSYRWEGAPGGGPTASSWAAYGPGLSVTLLPSLLAAWGDTHWLRPLLLGTGTLALTLLGARLRLKAPLLLGGAVLTLVTLHELAPYIAQVVDALPRWLPPALAGLMLLGVGATYEQRLRDARRLRDALGRMG